MPHALSSTEAVTERMKLAIMMRTIDQDGGLRVYVERLTEAMIKIAPEHSFLLLYRTKKRLGTFESLDNVREFLVKSPHKLFWDQVSVPYRAWREGADVIFNPKFSVPLISPCPVAMSLREPAWWRWREHYPWWNATFMRTMVPLYSRKSKALFPISQFVLDENHKYQTLSPEKIVVAYPAPDKHIGRVRDQAELDGFRREYRLPERFVLSVTRVDHPGIEESDSFFPGKNVETTVRAFIQCQDSIPHDLVLAGRRVREYLHHKGFRDEELGRVRFLGFVPHAKIPFLYSLADVFVIPTFYESYAHGLVESMLCGCPVVASKTGACPEISAGAALLADPDEPAEFAENILRILSDDELRRSLIEKGQRRAESFDWELTARKIFNKLLEISAPAHATGRER